MCVYAGLFILCVCMCVHLYLGTIYNDLIILEFSCQKIQHHIDNDKFCCQFKMCFCLLLLQLQLLLSAQLAEPGKHFFGEFFKISVSCFL